MHIIYAKQMGEKYYQRYLNHFANPDIHEFDMSMRFGSMMIYGANPY